MFAANRTAKVRGRIIFLIVSIRTMKGIKRVGVPDGIRWANKREVLDNQPYNIKPTHRGKDNDRLIII